jgi:hypothetical protein
MKARLKSPWVAWNLVLLLCCCFLTAPAHCSIEQASAPVTLSTGVALSLKAYVLCSMVVEASAVVAAANPGNSYSSSSSSSSSMCDTCATQPAQSNPLLTNKTATDVRARSVSCGMSVAVLVLRYPPHDHHLLVHCLICSSNSL